MPRVAPQGAACGQIKVQLDAALSQPKSKAPGTRQHRVADKRGVRFAPGVLLTTHRERRNSGRFSGEARAFAPSARGAIATPAPPSTA